MSTAIHHTERLSPENIHHLVHIYEKVYGKPISLEYYQKKYDTAYLGKSNLAYIAFDENNQAIAFQGFVPFRFTYRNSIEIGAISCDSMTIKEYNGKGIFTYLAKLGEQLLDTEGINFIYGFANQNSEYAAKNKFGWYNTERMVGFKIPVNVFPFEKFFRKTGLQFFFRKRVEAVMKPYKSKETYLPHSMLSDKHPTMLRDKSFFTYKSFLPSYIIEIEGVIIWLKSEKQLLIGDIISNNEDTLLRVIKTLKKICAKLGIPQIIFQLHPGSVQEIILRKHFESFDSWAIFYKSLNSTIPLENLRFNLGDLDTF